MNKQTSFTSVFAAKFIENQNKMPVLVNGHKIILIFSLILLFLKITNW